MQKRQNTAFTRRQFFRSTALAGGGLVLGVSWMASCGNPGEVAPGPGEADWVELNGYIKITPDGRITIISPNPEGGQNVKTSMPMIVAEELDADWASVTVEQAPLNTELYTRQFIGGSQALRQGWEPLRRAGAAVRAMLIEAAAADWGVPAGEIRTSGGRLLHEASGREAGYGDFATAAASLPVPESALLKAPTEFRLIGTSRKNVDGRAIVTGKPLFGIDVAREGMLIAMVVHPPAFGMQLDAVNEESIRDMPGIRGVFPVKVYPDDYTWQYFDTCSFNEVAAIVGETTWEVMQARNALEVNWSKAPAKKVVRDRFGTEQTLEMPAGLESTGQQDAQIANLPGNEIREQRRDGDPEAAFRDAARVISRDYTAPFLAHNCMEPMNFFAHVTENKAELAGPLQKPEYTEKTVSARLGIPLENIDIQITRLGGGYGRRSYAHWLVEAAVISKEVGAPVKLVYTREDDMTSGIYRPRYKATYRAALDARNRLTGFHVNAGGIPESPLYANRFPAGAVANYLAEDWEIPSNITVGSFRAPRSNFMAPAEQSFLDELAEAMGKDPIELRLELLEQAQANPAGQDNDYDPARYAGVLELVRDKSGWGQEEPGIYRGVSAYFCHNTYVAQVLDLKMVDGRPNVERVYCAVDCGIVVNPDAARNLVEGGVVDAIGNAFYGELTLADGKPEQANFDAYRMIRMAEAPKEIHVHFVQNGIDPTGLGEPSFPPTFAALANALYRATGRRFYSQPFMKSLSLKA
ncbi:xanthine dehydrogenase family protein molybdopterin-binding subunit [Robiginitalea sp. SC105]|uniref:xanthine dehydrogenase family protein molybdopterin-binding subunit n=1 Tax=Robiginitalea sp. SC105 TaxID=2762332 RepID=UPI00163AA947|nr:molybdopterin cofactor-binding domain-containing protein [Robiginitalea sp. SC105]MBC2839299.1 xanthine dehydrogenase family protein molybdopterin-binding subunit [Robiginitalea sp. SC105]